MPGAVTGAALYLPLSAAAYIVAVRDEHVGLASAVGAGVLGIAWNALPALHLVIAGRCGRDGRRQPEPPRADGDVKANRAYVEAMLGLQVWAHSLHQSIHRHAHERGGEHREDQT